MNIKEARKIIIRKFTNYRNKEMDRLAIGVSDRKMYQAMQDAAAALIDYRFLTKGKSLFKREMHDDIIKRRDVIYAGQGSESEGEDVEEENDGKRLPLIACYQRALKELWDEQDQDEWEGRGGDEPEDIHE